MAGYILDPVPDYNILLNSSTGLFEKSTESISNIAGDLVVYNSIGLAVIASADTELSASLNHQLSLSADNILADEIAFPVSTDNVSAGGWSEEEIGLDEEENDYTGGEGLNETLTDTETYSEYTSANDPDINTIIDEETIDMKVTLTLTLKSPVVKATYRPAESTSKTGVVKR